MKEKEFSDMNRHEDYWQTLQEYGENLRRQQWLAETIDRLAAAEPSARRKPMLLYVASGVAACLLLLLLVRPLTERGVSQPHPDELAQVAPADSAVRETVDLQADNRPIINEEIGQPNMQPNVQPDLQRQPRPRVRSNRSNQPAVLPVQLEEEPVLRQSVAETRPLPAESAPVPEWMVLDTDRDDVYEWDELPASLEPVRRRPVVKAKVAADSTPVAPKALVVQTRTQQFPADSSCDARVFYLFRRPGNDSRTRSHLYSYSKSKSFIFTIL